MNKATDVVDYFLNKCLSHTLYWGGGAATFVLLAEALGANLQPFVIVIAPLIVIGVNASAGVATYRRHRTRQHKRTE